MAIKKKTFHECNFNGLSLYFGGQLVLNFCPTVKKISHDFTHKSHTFSQINKFAEDKDLCFQWESLKMDFSQIEHMVHKELRDSRVDF